MFRLCIARKHVSSSVSGIAISPVVSSLFLTNGFMTSSATLSSCIVNPATKTMMRFCSTSANTAEQQADATSSNGAPAASSSSTTSEAEQLDQLFEEVSMLLDEPLPIGTLFKALSSESRNYVSSKRLSFETFLLRYPQKFQVFKQLTHRDRNIYVCKTGSAPQGANHAQEVAGTTVGAHAMHNGGVTDGARARIYTVLKYIPNEWASYVALPIPDDVKKKIIKKPAKSFFERNPRYFEVRFNPNMGHTFEVRRSPQLQEFMKQKTQMEGRK